MGRYRLGGLSTVPSSERPDLVAVPTWKALVEKGLLDRVGVAEIDASMSDTAMTQREYRLPPESLANCVVVAGKREGEGRFAACVVLATSRADVNGLVKRHLDVRKASFLPMHRAVGLTGMEYGGITPIGLPDGWPLLIDRAVVDDRVVVIGSGVRGSKLLLPGSLLSGLSGALVLAGLGLPIQA
jgi:prolyl-tRNA editing enzyme YbaK/EbsC (Cys-tRNA(Pro) deacylase)